jgi:hypothetical protein
MTRSTLTVDDANKTLVKCPSFGRSGFRRCCDSAVVRTDRLAFGVPGCGRDAPRKSSVLTCHRCARLSRLVRLAVAQIYVR